MNESANKSELIALVALFLLSFMSYQFYFTHQEVNQLKIDLGKCRERDIRTDQMIDKLRGFNH